jgi:methionyl-tRNA formyltransferase
MYKIIFMGTPEFAVASLRALVESKKYEIVAVVSQPDRPKGTGQEDCAHAGESLRGSVGLTVLQPLKVKTPEVTAQLSRLPAGFYRGGRLRPDLKPGHPGYS